MLRLAVAVMMVMLCQCSLAADDGLITVNCTLKPPESGPRIYFVVADLGAVQAGNATRIQIVLKNETDTDFNIGSIQTSCSCVRSLSSSLFTMKQGGEAKLPFRLEAPAQSAKSEQKTVVTIGGKGGGDQNFRIVVKYKLAGLLCFEKQAFYANVPSSEKRATLRIPYVSSAPVQSNRITARCTGQLADLKCTVDGSFINVEVPEIDYVAGNPGLLVIEDPAVSTSAELRLFMNVKSPFDFAPSHLRFEWDDSADAYTAEYICSAASVSSTEAEKRKRRLQTEAWVAEPSDGWQIQTAVRLLSNRVGRITVQLHPDDNVSDDSIVEGRIGMKLRYASEELTTELPFKLFRSPDLETSK